MFRIMHATHTALGIVVLGAFTSASAVFAQQQSPPAASQDSPSPPQAPAPPPASAAVPAPVAPASSLPRKGFAGANVNLRSGPGTDAAILTTIPAGSTIQITSCTGEWCAVTWNGQSGYAVARNLGTGKLRRTAVYPARRYYAGPPVVYEPPVVYGPPVVYRYYGPRYYYGGWGWRRRWW